jgi:hypothetical protein
MHSLIREKLVLVTAVAAACVLFAIPATAVAAQDTSYVDDDAPDDVPPCIQADPCQQISTAIGDTNANGTVIVDGGTYNQNVSLSGSKSLTGQEFTGAAEGTPLIDGDIGSAIFVDVGQAGGTVQGFQLRSTGAAVELSGQANFTNNVFDSTANSSTGLVIGNAAAGGSTIGPNNTFTDDGVDSEQRFGVSVEAGNPLVTGNTFTALSQPLNLTGGGPMVVGNTITGYHDPVADPGAIQVNGGNPTIVANHIHSPDPNSSSTTGINFPGGPGGTLRRNRVFDHDIGVHVLTTTTPVTMHSDAIVGNDRGLFAVDFPSAGSESDVTVTNVTISGSTTQDIQLAGNVLTLDSSILEQSIAVSGGATCVITNTRGPSVPPVPSAEGCDNFQTAAAPTLAADGFHLLAGSPMIDLGNPVVPLAPNDLDVDGEPRAIAGTCGGTVRRDIGADEFSPGCAPPVTPIVPVTPSAAPTAPPAKKCKKGRKLKKGKCVKKRKKKK